MTPLLKGATRLNLALGPSPARAGADREYQWVTSRGRGWNSLRTSDLFQKILIVWNKMWTATFGMWVVLQEDVLHFLGEAVKSIASVQQLLNYYHGPDMVRCVLFLAEQGSLIFLVLLPNYTSKEFHYTRFDFVSECHDRSAGVLGRLLCALVGDQWQHPWNVTWHSSFNAEHDAGQVIFLKSLTLCHSALLHKAT